MPQLSVQCHLYGHSAFLFKLLLNFNPLSSSNKNELKKCSLASYFLLVDMFSAEYLEITMLVCCLGQP